MEVFYLNKIDGKELIFRIKLNQQRSGEENKKRIQERTGEDGVKELGQRHFWSGVIPMHSSEVTNRRNIQVQG